MYENLNPVWSASTIFEMIAFLCGAAIIGYLIYWFLHRNTNTSTNCQFKQEFEDKYRKLEAELHEFKNSIQTRIHQVEADNKRQDEQIAKLNVPSIPMPSLNTDSSMSKQEATLASIKPIVQNLSIASVSVNPNEKDDLKLIKGVGPFIEKKVNALGIFTFKQVSKLSNDDINKITDAIQFFPGRIQRDNWIDQAKELNKNG